MNEVMKKPTIGLFIDAFFPMVDGVIVVVDQYAKHLMDVANVVVFAPRSSDKAYVDDRPYQVYRSRQIKILFTDYNLPLPWIDHAFKKVLKHIKLDLVHIHSPFSMGHVGIRYAKKHHIPVIGTLHSQYKLDFYERTKSKIITDIALKEMIHTFNQCDELWAVNQKIAEIYTQDGTYNMPRVQQNATDMLPFKDEQKELALKKKYEIKNDEKILLYVGRLDFVKNLDFMLESLYRLRLKGFKFKMLFVGSGPYEKEMKSLAKKYGLTDKTLFVGRITDRTELAMHYKIADLFLFPSIYDSSSLVQIEAASQKTPTLFLRNTATSSTVTEDVNGYFSDHDPLLYAEKIIEIFKNQKLYIKIKEQCFKDLYITWKEVTERVFERYLLLIEQKRTSSN